jgi:hypothetical protein
MTAAARNSIYIGDDSLNALLLGENQVIFART